jgi:6,7-dimethyl-8-ribityllumazine synthase
MSRTGAPAPTAFDARRLPVAIVASRWHTTVMDGLIGGALRACTEHNAEPQLIRVPGSFELPLGAAAAIDRGYPAVVALGVVIRGGTPHFEYVCRAATDQLSRLAVDTRRPIGFGLLTCDSEEQALARAGLPASADFSGSVEDKGYEATAAAVELAATVAGLEPVGS